MGVLEYMTETVVAANKALIQYQSTSVSSPSVLKPDVIALLGKKITEAIEYWHKNRQEEFPTFRVGLITKAAYIYEISERLLKELEADDPLHDLIQSLSSDLDGLCDLSGYVRISQSVREEVEKQLESVGVI